MARRMAHFNDPKLESQIQELIDAINRFEELATLLDSRLEEVKQYADSLMANHLLQYHDE